mgnify:CR=1 FL=1
MKEMEKNKKTTIKISDKTKKRLDHIKLHSKESYEETLQRIIDILNICHSSPERARAHLIKLDRVRNTLQRPLTLREKPKAQVSSQLSSHQRNRQSL